MARQFKGAHEVNIPIDEIMRTYAAWADEIRDAVGKELLKEVRAQARTAFFDDNGLLRRSISRKRSKFDKETHIVGAFAPHAHLVEFGTKLRVSKKTGKVSGHMPASPFLGPAGASVEARLQQIVESVVPPTVEVK